MDVRQLSACRVLVRKVKRSGGRNCYYSNQEVSVTESGSITRKYDGEIVVKDPNEMEAAGNIQKMVHRYFQLGVHTDFGIVLPLSRVSEAEVLDREISEAVSQFNGAAQYSRLRFVAGALETTGEGASVLESMLDDITEKLEALETALGSMEPTTIRKALAGFQKGYLEMLPADAAALVNASVQKSREAATALNLGTRRLSRLDRRLEEITGGQNALEALERLQSENRTAAMESKAKAIASLLDEKAEVVDQIEGVKREIAAVPVSLARFVCMREIEPISAAPAETPSAVLARFANMTSAEDIMTEAERDSAE